MKVHHKFLLFLLFIISILTPVFVITFSKTAKPQNEKITMNSLSLEKEEPIDTSNILFRRICFNHRPLGFEKLSQHEYEKYNIQDLTCKEYQKKYIENCIGFFEKCDDCDALKDKYENCLINDEDM